MLYVYISFKLLRCCSECSHRRTTVSTAIMAAMRLQAVSYCSAAALVQGGYPHDDTIEQVLLYNICDSHTCVYYAM